MLTTGPTGGAGGGGGGGAAHAALPPLPPIIIIMHIIIIGSIPWLLLDARSLMELVIWVIIVVSWSFDELARDVTRDAPPRTRARSFEATELNGFFLSGMVRSFVVTSRFRAAAMPAPPRPGIAILRRDRAADPASNGLQAAPAERQPAAG
jgi:hypothetical protein